ncbi:hypothetical protein [Spiroplasma ixodetis]|uniref:hypothetical protein n=1 Tax=Spiroplasma ixodetis TaxID=2141 RepID=UPI00257681D9|nr:hypothetical protein [Spiroplasma ixodetis]
MIACLTTYGILIFILVMINSRKTFEQRIGYILGLVIGVGSIVVTLLPLIIVSIASLDNEVITLVLGLSFVFIGLNGGLVACGSLFGLIVAKKYYKFMRFKEKVDIIYYLLFMYLLLMVTVNLLMYNALIVDVC